MTEIRVIQNWLRWEGDCMALSAGTRLGPYEILAPLGAGGMGNLVGPHFLDLVHLTTGGNQAEAVAAAVQGAPSTSPSRQQPGAL